MRLLRADKARADRAEEIPGSSIACHVKVTNNVETASHTAAKSARQDGRPGSLQPWEHISGVLDKLVEICI